MYVKGKNASYSLRTFYDFVIVQSANVFGYGALAHLSAIRVHLEYEKWQKFASSKHVRLFQTS